MAVRVESFVVGAFQENAYLLLDEATRRCVFVDPGAEGDRLVRAVRAHGAELEAIWLTHAHIDHVGGIPALKRAWPDAPIFLHPADRPLYDRVLQQAAYYGLPMEALPAPDRELADGDLLQLGELEVRALHTPGHAPGHCLLLGDGVAFAGDLVFAGSIGRTDLPLSNPAHMTESLERIVAEVPDATVLRPGHGPATTMAEERRSNPFLTGAARVLGG